MLEILALSRRNVKSPKAGERELGVFKFVEGEQWLEVRCSFCDVLARGDKYETEAAEELQREHSDDFRHHRVNVELFFRMVVSTRINQTPKLAGDPQTLNRG